MKVALLVPGFSAGERDWCIPALLDYVRALARRVEVHVFALRWPPRLGRYEVYGAAVYALGGGRAGGAPGRWARALQAIRVEHRRAPFDVLHAFWADEPGWVGTLAASQVGRPLLVSLAGGELTGMRAIGYGVQLLPGRPALVRWVLRRAQRVLAGSRYMCGLAAAHLPPRAHAKLSYAPLGVDMARFVPPAAEPVGGVLNVGSLYPVKDQGRLLRVVARLPGTRASVAGTGPLRDRLEALASDLGLAERVSFLGEVDHGRMAGVYGAAQVLVQTSRHEAQGMAVLEAAACEVPTVGTPVGVVPEVGFAADEDGALIESLAALLADARQRRAAGDRARQYVAEQFELEVCQQRFAALYGGAAASSSCR